MSSESSHLLPAAIGAVACIGIFLALYDRIHRDSPLVKSWTLGMACLICALAVQHIRLQQWNANPSDPLVASHSLLLIPAFLFAIGSLCYWHGVRCFLHLPTPWRSRLLLGGVLLAGVAAYSHGTLTPLTLNAFRDGFVAAVYGLVALDFLRASAATGAYRPMRIFSGFSAGVSITFWACAGLRFLPSIEEPALERGIFVVIILTVCSGIFCSMLLFHETRSVKIAALHELAIERERELTIIRTHQRISRSIHDSIAGANTSISLLAARESASSSTEQCLHALEQIRWLSSELGDDIHLVINGIDGPPVSGRRWLGQVRHYTVGALRAAGIDCRWTAEGFDDRPMGDPLAVAEFQRSLKESVHNIIRHSRASSASFSLELQGGRLVILIEDDGVGIPADPPPGRGLTGLRATAAALDGSFSLESPPAGSRMRFQIPLPMTRLP